MAFLEQLRKPKVFGMAIFDLVTAFFGMVIIFYLAWKHHFSTLSFWPFGLSAVLLTLPVGIFIHVLFGVNTSLNYKLGLSLDPETKTKADD